MAVLQKDLNLLIDDLDLPPNTEKHQTVKQYDVLLADYMVKLQHRGILHRVGVFRPYM